MIGYEFEFLVREGDRPLSRKTFERFHTILSKQEWETCYDPKTKGVVGSKKDGIYVTTDDGVCIMEVNMPPRDTIIEADKEMRKILHWLQSVYDSIGCSIIGTSVFPSDIGNPENTLCSKSYIKYYNPIRFSEHWEDLLFLASNHVWLDVPKQDLLSQWKFYNKLTPVVIALFANGPLHKEKQLDILDGRDTLWHNMLDTSTVKEDKRFFGMPDQEFESLTDYFSFMLSMPFYYTLRDGVGVSVVDKGMTYHEFFTSEAVKGTFCDGAPLTLRPEVEDFFRIQQVTFPWVRIKYRLQENCTINEILNAIESGNDKALLHCFSQTFLECRAVGAQSQSDISASPAFLLGLQSSADARNFLSSITYESSKEQYHTALKRGIKDDKMYGVAKQLVDFAYNGLVERAAGEELFLEPVFERLRRKENPADKLIQLFDMGGIESVYDTIDFSAK